MPDAYLLEDGTGRYLLEDGSGVYLLDSPYVVKSLGLGAVGHWRANEASGNVQDSSPSANHATSMGGATYGEPSLMGDTADTAITLTPPSSFALVPDANSLDIGDTGTYVIWVEMLTRTGNVALIDKGANSIQLAWDGTNKRFRMNVNNLGGDVCYSSLATDDALPHMVAIGKSGATRKVWVDGVDRTTTGTNQTAASTATALNIGRNANTGENTNMTWDHASIYPTLLTDADIAALFALRTASPVTVTPGAAALTLGAHAPTVTATANQSVSPGVAALMLTAQTPTVTASDHKTAAPSTATLVLSAQVPTVRLGINVVPGAAALTLAAIAPSVTASDHKTITPGVVSFTLAAQAPTVTASDHKLVAPGTAGLILFPQMPTVTATANQTVTPVPASLVLTPQTPIVTAGGGLTATPGVAALALTAFAPTVVLSDHMLVTLETAALVLTTFVPTVTASANLVVIPGTAPLVLTSFSPTVTGSVVDHRGTVGAAIIPRETVGTMAVLRDTVVIAYGPGAFAGAASADVASVGVSVAVRDSVGAGQS